MHYKGHIITKKIPTTQQLAKILSKYRDGSETEQIFNWDWYAIGGRYGGKINIHFDPNENEDNWYLGSRHKRNYKYFIIAILEDIEKEVKYYDELEYLQYMGLNDKILHVDGGYFKDTIDFDITNCFLVVDDNEEIYIREAWDGNNWIEDKDFDNKVKGIDLKDKFITVIDFHS